MPAQQQDPESLASLLRQQRTKTRSPNNNENEELHHRPPSIIGRRHPVQLLKITSICGLSAWFLHEKMNLFHNILHSHKVSHTWFKLGLAMSIAILAIKGYMEIYEGKINKKQISYKTYPNCTHAVIILGLLTNIAFGTSLWPLYGTSTLWIIPMFGFGVLLQIMLIVPVWGQNILSVVVLMYFLQEYK